MQTLLGHSADKMAAIKDKLERHTIAIFLADLVALFDEPLPPHLQDDDDIASTEAAANELQCVAEDLLWAWDLEFPQDQRASDALLAATLRSMPEA
jgi:hypothetical protein